ncbi:MAG: hypothetical protein JWQ01_3965 [Massilia sp.]|jgi:hypothetical protein|nr:hypothetical protein [Massilia sp.]
MNPDTDFAPIAALDLNPIKVKLMHKESGEGWSRSYADAVEFEYRRFLHLVKKFPHEHTAPLFDVDVFWHYHILDTMKYATDCDAVFGYFLHHFPYVGLRGEDDLETHHRVGQRMRELYEQTYGEDYIRKGAPGYGSARGEVAFSSPATKEMLTATPDSVAFSSPAAMFAFSSPAVWPSLPCAAAETAQVAPPGWLPAALSYSIRPTLSRAV